MKSKNSDVRSRQCQPTERRKRRERWNLRVM